GNYPCTYPALPAARQHQTAPAAARPPPQRRMEPPLKMRSAAKSYPLDAATIRCRLSHTWAQVWTWNFDVFCPTGGEGLLWAGGAGGWEAEGGCYSRQ